jgi:hypothetical protein
VKVFVRSPLSVAVPQELLWTRDEESGQAVFAGLGRATIARGRRSSDNDCTQIECDSQPPLALRL